MFINTVFWYSIIIKWGLTPQLKHNVVLWLLSWLELAYLTKKTAVEICDVILLTVFSTKSKNLINKILF